MISVDAWKNNLEIVCQLFNIGATVWYILLIYTSGKLYTFYG
jgi:hypothetical protein